MPASGEVLAAIKARAADKDLPLGRAVIDLLQEGQVAIALQAVEPVAAPIEPAPEFDLDTLATGDLLAELGRRFAAGVAAHNEIADLRLRAEQAETTVARIKGALLDTVMQ